MEALKRCKSLRDNPVFFAQQRLSQNIQLEEYWKQKILIDRDNCDFGWYGLCFGQVVLSLIFNLGEIEDWIHPDSDLKQIWWKSWDERFWMQKKMHPVNTSVELMEGSKKTLPSAHILKIGKFYHFVRDEFWLLHLKFWQEFTLIFNICFISFSPSSTLSQLTPVIWKMAFLKSISWWRLRSHVHLSRAHLAESAVHISRWHTLHVCHLSDYQQTAKAMKMITLKNGDPCLSSSHFRTCQITFKAI